MPSWLNWEEILLVQGNDETNCGYIQHNVPNDLSNLSHYQPLFKTSLSGHLSEKRPLS
jgi:hypothetical protein